MDRIFKPVGKQTAQIGDLKSGKRRSSDGNRKPDLLFFCAVCIKRKNKIQCFIVTILCDRALRKRNSDLLNIFEGILFFILHNTAFKKMQMMSQIMAINGGLSLQLGKLADFFSGLNGNCGKQQIFLLQRN